MNKLTTKLFAKVGDTIEASDGRKGVVRQANPDGALFVQFPDERHTIIVWAPVPEAPAAAKPKGKVIEVTEAEMQAYAAEMTRLQALAASRAASLDEATAVIKDLKVKLAAAEANLAAGVRTITALPTPGSSAVTK